MLVLAPPSPWNALPGGALSDYYFLAACALGSWAPGPVRRACELRRRPGTESTRPSSTDSEIAQPRTASASPPPARAPPAAMMVVLRGREGGGGFAHRPSLGGQGLCNTFATGARLGFGKLPISGA